jgi:DNA polymerase III delta prime subunit
MITWTQPNMSLTKIENNETDRSYHADYQVYESQAKLFDQFLFKSSRYISDQIFCTEQRTKKLLFIKDIPLFAYREPLNFQKQLRQFIKYSKYSLVICLTTSPVQSNETNPIKVLTLELRKELNMQEVTFNPLAVSYMNKQVERIAQLENLSFLDSNSINEICQSSDGDLRHAINILELATVRTKPSSAIGSTTAAKKRKLNTQKTKENISEPSSGIKYVTL